jgi:polar amino acid transport system substrate-binding protein
MKRTACILALAVAVVAASGAKEELLAQRASDQRVADIVANGQLRAGIGVVAPHWAVKDPTTGELRGVAIDLGKALADRIGVPFVPVEYPSPPAILDGLKSNAWDVAFLGVDPSRAGAVDFTPPYLQIDATYLVPARSGIQAVADADRPGTRIAVSRNSVEEVALKRTLKRAELRSVDTVRAGFDLLRAGQVDVFAAPRPTLIQFSAQLSDSRVLDDRFNATYGAMAVPKGLADRLAFMRDFIEDAKASGMVQRAIEHAKVRGVQAVAVESTKTR